MSKTLNIQYCSYLRIISSDMNSIALRLEFPSRWKQVRAPFDITRYTHVYRYRDVSETGWMRNVAVKGWYWTVRSLPTAGGRRGMTGGQWGASPMTNSACFQSPESLGGCQNSRKQRDGRVSISTDPTTTRLCSKRFTHSRATEGGGGCEAPDISAYDYIACFAMFDIRRFNNMPLLGVLEARNICMGNFDAGFAAQHKE